MNVFRKRQRCRTVQKIKDLADLVYDLVRNVEFLLILKFWNGNGLDELWAVLLIQPVSIFVNNVNVHTVIIKGTVCRYVYIIKLNLPM